MSSVPPSSAGSARPSLDVRSLTLVQLHKLAAQGSRRARAELEGRMRAAGSGPAPEAPPAPAAAPTPAMAPAPTAPLAPAAPPDRAAARVPAAPRTAATSPAPAQPPASDPQLQQAEQLALLARQDEQRERISGPPRLVGLVMIIWGALFLLGSLAMLGHLGGLYYLYCALGSIAIGWLLMRCSRWAMALHGALLLGALGWAFASAGGIGMALAQAIPLLIPVLWMAVPSVREPLE